MNRFALLVGLVLLVSAPAASQTSTDTPLRWEVTERSRYTALMNQFRPGLSGDDQALAFRTTLRVDVPIRRLTLIGELQDARAYLTDDESNVTTALVNALDLLQAQARFTAGATARPIVPDAQVGRFSMELGSGRLVAQEVYRDVTRTFTGASLRWRRPDLWTLTGFAVLPVLTLPDDRAGLLANRVQRDQEHLNLKFWGALYERARRGRDARAEVYFYGLDEHDVPGERETRDRRLWTVGGRVFRNAGPKTWDTEVEGAWQGGRAHASTVPSDVDVLDVSAGYLHAGAGYTWAQGWSPRLGVEYDYGSGDKDPSDRKWDRFDMLFGNRRVDLGPSSIYGALGRENIQTFGVRASIAPTPRFDAFAVWRWVGLASATDSFASTGVRDPSGTSGQDAARQLDVRVRAWIVPRVLRVEAGATYLAARRFLREAPNATRLGNTTFVYTDVTYTVGAR